MDAFQLTVLATAALATSILSAVVGMAGGITLLSVMLLFLEPLTAIPLHGVVQLISNASRTAIQRRYVDRAILWRYSWFLLPMGFAGLAVAQALPSSGVRAGIGLFVLLATWAPAWLMLGTHPERADPSRRFAALGVIPSMQGSHQTSDMYWIEERLGPERVNGAYAWRSLRDTGVIIPNGSDTPVEFPNPLISFRAFFTRMDAEGYPEGGWHPEQRMTRQEALLSVTLWPAQASFMEEDVGSLVRGKYADFVVLDRDIMTVAESEILDSQVIMTFLGGERVFSREN